MPIPGLMQDRPVTRGQMIDHAAAWHGRREIVSRSIEGPIVRTVRGGARAREAISNALTELGVQPGDRVATLAWKHRTSHRGVVRNHGIGAVCHTLNPRLFVDQLATSSTTLRIASSSRISPSYHAAREARWAADRPAYSSAHRPRSHAAAGRAGIALLRGPRRAASPTACGVTSTSTPRLGSATPRARRATPRACSTRTARISAHARDAHGGRVRACHARCSAPIVPMFHANAGGLPSPLPRRERSS